MVREGSPKLGPGEDFQVLTLEFCIIEGFRILTLVMFMYVYLTVQDKSDDAGGIFFMGKVTTGRMIRRMIRRMIL